jgi:aryl-alcohol dehydrogenase-like predicted oxidoreductase
MRYRKLGASTLQVSEIALGSWLTYGVGVEQRDARDCLRAAFDAGINFIDTANVYGRGAAESLLGELLREHRRDDYVLATKLYFPMSTSDRGLSRAQVHKQIDASLKRLRTDHVDLYQCHRYDEETPLEETMQALSEVVRAGKARYIGFSEWTADQIRAARELAGVEHFVSSQPQYSMLWRKPEADVIPVCRELDIGQIVWSPLAQGVLTGKYKPHDPPPEGTRATSDSMSGFMDRFMKPELLEAVAELGAVAEIVELEMSQLALAWVLREPNVSSAIIGATRPEQVAENARASGVTLDAEVLETIDKLLGDVIRR